MEYVKYDNVVNILSESFEKNITIKIINNDNLILKKKKLIEISKNLTNLEYLEIFNIIQEDNCTYSQNKNGVFINLSNISENTIDKIFNFINFIKHKKEDLIKYEEYVNIAKKNIDTNINKVLTENNIETEPRDKYYENYENEEEDEEEKKVTNNYLLFSSDEDEDLENKISLKKKKTKYSGKKAKIIKSIKDTNDINKFKSKTKKLDE